MNSRIKLIFLGLLTIATIYIPYHLIDTYETVKEEGELFKFKVRLFDPSDPFRGKYLNLDYDIASIKLTPKEDINEYKYFSLDKDSYEFAKIKAVSNIAPQSPSYLKCKIKRNFLDSTQYQIIFGFTKYFINENKSVQAEEIYFNALRDTNTVVYAEVFVKDGYGVLNHIRINDVLLEDLLD